MAAVFPAVGGFFLQASATSLLLDPREYWSGLDRHSRLLAISIGASILLHVVLLSVHFRFPDALRWKTSHQPLEVILVNSKTHEKPEKAKALAQAHLDGGGNTSDRRRATTPLPVTNPREPGRRPGERGHASTADPVARIGGKLGNGRR